MLSNLSSREIEEEIPNETLPFGCLKNYMFYFFLLLFGLTFSTDIFILKSGDYVNEFAPTIQL